MKEKIATSGAYFLLSGVLVLCDQLIKQWAQTSLKQVGSITLIDGMIGLRYAENTGAAFSAFSGETVLLSLLSLAVCIAIVCWLAFCRQAFWGMKISLSMILAGGIGNLIDRVARGFVVDLFEVLFIRFAIFNAADIFITLGAVGMFIILMFGGRKCGNMEN